MIEIAVLHLTPTWVYKLTILRWKVWIVRYKLVIVRKKSELWKVAITIIIIIIIIILWLKQA